MLKKIIILKNLSHILSFVLLLGFTLVSFNLLAQTTPKDSIQNVALDSLALPDAWDSISVAETSDSIFKPDTKGMDSLKMKKGDIETTIYYHAEDSIMMDVPNKKAYLFGKAQIKYQDMQLDAAQIEIQWDKNIIGARGYVDTAGRYRDRPVWRQGADIYVTDSMKYNMQSKKAIIHSIETKQGEGFLQGDTSKRTEEAIYLKNGIYTTCNLKHPHFKILARKLKVIPDDKAVCGPFNMVFEDIPTPIGFWMGFFPITDRKRSGIIFPTFGENQTRGLYLSHGGYYWAVNDYLGIQTVGDVYANGSFLVNSEATYLKKYQYRGTMDLSLAKLKNGFDDSQQKLPTQFNLIWQHATTAQRSGNFIASVNLSSSKYSKATIATTNRTQNITNSSVTYNRSFKRTPFSTSISMRGSENNYQSTATNNNSAIYTMTLPAVSLTMNRINPLKRKYGNGSKWYEKIFVNYQGNFSYDLKNTQQFYDPVQKIFRDSALQVNDANLRKYILPNSVWASNHTTTISTTFKLFKYINVNPSASYFENLQAKKLIYKRVGDTLTTVTDTLKGLYSSHYYNTAVEVNTRFYGLVNLPSRGFIQGFRHTANPSIRFTYAPDARSGGGWVTVPNDPKVNGEVKRYNEYLSNSSPQFKQEVLDFTLSNILEMKVRNKRDTSGTSPTKKINLLDNLSIAGGYNFGADSLKMKDITLNARTKLLNRFDVTMASDFDPYQWYADSASSILVNGQKILYNTRKTNTFLINSTGKLAQLNTLNLTVGTRFAPKKKGAKDPKFNNPQMQSELDRIRANPNQYIDFNIPWSLSLSFTYNYTHNGLYNPVINEAIAANGDFSITPKWKFVYSTGFNFRDHAITYSNFTISRDLHCWQMNMTLSPFGTLRTFNFMIAAKSQLLQTLKLNKRSPSFVQ